MNGENRTEIEIDLHKLLLVYLRRWWLILLCGLIAGGATLFYTMNYVTPLYRTGVSIYVNNTKSNQQIESVSTANLSASKQLVSTYIHIIYSDRVLDKVVVELGGDYTTDYVRKRLSAAQMDDTEIFEIFITHADPKEATRIVNTVAEVAPDEIASLIEGSSARIIDCAKVPSSRYSPSYGRNTAFGAVTGVVVALIYITLRYLMDVRIKTGEDLAQLFDIPVLGQIPTFASTDAKKKSGYGYVYRDYGNTYSTSYPDHKSDGKEGR